jgi:hypothetical protein
VRSYWERIVQQLYWRRRVDRRGGKQKATAVAAV